MYVVSISKDAVFYYLNQEHEVYAFDYKDEEVVNLRHEIVEDIWSMTKDDDNVFFILEEDKDK